MASQDDAAIYEIAYAEAVRALSEQHGVIESFRARAGLLLSSAAVTTSFLAGPAFQGSGTGVFTWLALLDFAAVVVLTVAILKPRPWEVGVDLNEAIGSDAVPEDKIPPSGLYLALSLELRRVHGENRAALDHLAILLQTAGSLLAAEIALWIAAIATTS